MRSLKRETSAGHPSLRQMPFKEAIRHPSPEPGTSLSRLSSLADVLDETPGSALTASYGTWELMQARLKVQGNTCSFK